jgi:hypothetical protein
LASVGRRALAKLLDYAPRLTKRQKDKNMATPYIKTSEGLTAIVNGKAFSITNDNPSYGQVWDALQKGESDDTVESLFNTALAIRRWSGNQLEVVNDQLYYKGEVVNGVVARRIVELITQGENADSLIKFLENLLANPSRRAVEELYTFLQHQNLPITEDGCFLAYKGVRDDYLDVHSGRFSNRPGAKYEMLRNLVDDDARVACSNGFHVGSLEYATSFGTRTVITKVNPADVVSVPFDSGCQKLRTAAYEVICDYQGPLPKALHTDSPYADVSSRWDDDDYYAEADDNDEAYLAD